MKSASGIETPIELAARVELESNARETLRASRPALLLALLHVAWWCALFVLIADIQPLGLRIVLFATGALVLEHAIELYFLRRKLDAALVLLRPQDVEPGR